MNSPVVSSVLASVGLRKAGSRRVKIAVSYWLITCLTTLTLRLPHFAADYLGILPLVALTAPWSLLIAVVADNAALDGAGAFQAPIGQSAGIWVLFPVICGGLNAVLIHEILIRYAQWKEDRKRATASVPR